MKSTASLAALCALAILTLGATFGRVSITWPAADVGFRPGPGVETVSANCSACHSAAYVYTQPRLTRAQWKAEVAKMKAAYGAPVADADVDAIVDYLVAQNGKT
jgi:cytochrome c5